MNARKVSKIRVGLTATALALCGVLAMSCAGGDSNNNASGGSSGSGGSGGGGSGGGGNGSGGSSSTGTDCPDSPGEDQVNFCSGKAQGVMAGYAYIALGKLNTATDPVCAEDSSDTSNTREITKDSPCPDTGTTVWKAKDSLCISGTIPVVTGGDYKNNWGLQIGVNTVDPPATAAGEGTLNKDYSSITMTTTGTIEPKNTAIRIVIHTVDMAAEADPYCATLKESGKVISLESFNTACWDGTGDSLSLDKVKDIDKVGIQISSDTASEYKVTDFCLTGIQFGN